MMKQVLLELVQKALPTVICLLKLQWSRVRKLVKTKISNFLDGSAKVSTVPRQFVYGHFVYDTSSTDISSTDISSTTVYQRVGQLYIQLLFLQTIIFINSNFYLHYDSVLSIPLPMTLC